MLGVVHLLGFYCLLSGEPLSILEVKISLRAGTESQRVE
jgi:hypothetical protein